MAELEDTFWGSLSDPSLSPLCDEDFDEADFDEDFDLSEDLMRIPGVFFPADDRLVDEPLEDDPLVDEPLVDDPPL